MPPAYQHSTRLKKILRYFDDIDRMMYTMVDEVSQKGGTPQAKQEIIAIIENANELYHTAVGIKKHLFGGS